MKRNIDMNVHVRPPESWREILLGQGEGWPMNFLNRLSSGIKNNPVQESNSLHASYYQIIVLLSSMEGPIFINQRGRQALGLNPPDSRSSAGHVRNMLQLCFQELLPYEIAIQKIRSDSITSSDSVLTAVRSLLSLASSHHLKDFVEGISAVSHDTGSNVSDIIASLSSITISMITEAEQLNETASECANSLVEMWTELCIDSDLPNHLGTLHQDFSRSAGLIFSAYMSKELNTVALEVFQDEEEYEGDEEAASNSLLSSLAIIGRASHTISFPALESHLNQSKKKLQSKIAQHEDVSVPLEEICWLMKVSSFTLADSGEGETPMIPQILVDEILNKCDINNNHLISLSRVLLNLAGELRASISTGITSSRLMEEVCVALGRWAETYLVFEESSGFSMVNSCFGPGHEGPLVTNFLIELATVALAMFPGERTLHLSVCKNLLKPLSSYPSTRFMVIHSSAWNQLCEAVWSGSGLGTLESEVHLELSLVLCLCSAGFNDEAEVETYVRNLIGSNINKLLGVNNVPAIEFQRPDNLMLTVNAISSLRGAAKAGHTKTHSIIFKELSKSFDLVTGILVKSKDIVLMYNIVLEFVADIMEYHAAVLNQADSQALFKWAVEVTKLHAANKMIFNGLAVSSSSHSFDDECDSLVSLIRLLTQITNIETPSNSEIASIIFSGMESIMPLLTIEHLKVPVLCHGFFALLAYMVEAHPEKVCQMSNKTFEAFLQALCYGINIKDDSETESAVFEAVGALAKHITLSYRHGGQGLGANGSIVLNNKPPLAFLFEAILERIVFDDPGVEALDFAAEPVLYICAQDPMQYLDFLKALCMTKVSDQISQLRVTECVDKLQKRILQSLTLDRQARQMFLPEFRESIIKIRGYVRKK